jgi:predicted nucleic acid-binding protein
MKILLDTNIALNILLERQPFCETDAKVLGLSQGGIKFFISASAITDIFYIIHKQKGKDVAMSLLTQILLSVDVATVSGAEIRRAVALDWDDFEDAVQYAVGESLAVNYVVTRNATDFNAVELQVLSPEELLHSVVRDMGS